MWLHWCAPPASNFTRKTSSPPALTNGPPPKFTEPARTGTGSSRRLSATLDRNFVYLAERVAADGRTFGFAARLSLTICGPRNRRRSGGARGDRRVLPHPVPRGLHHLLAPGAAAQGHGGHVAVARGDLKRDPPDEDDPEAAALDAVRRMKNTLLACSRRPSRSSA
jgi:hypothetical protein